jgi:hypothetical protein
MLVSNILECFASVSFFLLVNTMEQKLLTMFFVRCYVGANKFKNEFNVLAVPMYTPLPGLPDVIFAYQIS